MKFAVSMVAVGIFAQHIKAIQLDQVSNYDPDSTDTADDATINGFGNGRNEPTPVTGLTVELGDTWANLSWTAGAKPKNNTKPIDSFGIFVKRDAGIPEAWDESAPGYYMAPAV